MGSQNKRGETVGTLAADPKEHYRVMSETLKSPALKANFGYLAIKLPNPQVPQRN